MKRILLVASAVLVAVAGTASTVLHVDAERGDDAGDGSAARPFKTSAKAKEAVRALKKAGAPGGVVVEMEGVFSGLKGPVGVARREAGRAPHRRVPSYGGRLPPRLGRGARTPQARGAR